MTVSALLLRFSCSIRSNTIPNPFSGFYSNVRHLKTDRSDILKLLKEMPKDMTHVSELQKQRQAKKATKTAYPPSTVKMQVLGTGVNGAPRSLYIFTDVKCYLFNCGEGSQRIAHENKFKVAKVEDIFFTRTCWANVGGLPGMALTIQDVGVPTINLHGAFGLEDLFLAASRFIILDHLKVSHCDATAPNNTNFEDTVMKVEYIPISPVGNNNETSGSNEIKKDSSNRNSSPIEEDDIVNYYDKGEIPAAKRKRTDSGKPSSPSVPLSGQDVPQAGSQAVINYLCRLHPKKGTLLPEKCFELGVPPGPLYGKLKDGFDVTLKDGRIVTANDVRTPDDPGPVFLVVECPDESYLDTFVTEPRLAGNLHSAGPLESPQVIVHFTPSEIIDHPKYKAWMDGFKKETTHLMIGPSRTAKRGFGSVGVHRLQHKLHLIDSEIFPLLNIDMPLESEQLSDECQTGLAFYLRPNKRLVSEYVPRLNLKEYVDETLAVPGLPAAIESMKTTVAQSVPLSDRKYPKVIFLGTGSAIPNKTRNTSAILVETSPDHFILMDCGEGTYGQLVRMYGTEKATQILSCLKAIYISHLHADHHIGLIGLLLGRKRSLAEAGIPHSQIQLIAPQQINYWLKTYHYNFESIRYEFQLVGCASLLANQSPNLELLNHLGISSMVTTYVIHCPNSFGVALTTLDGFKLTYSGDTMPSPKLIELGNDSDLLIHEATMEDGMEAEARKKTHSTTSQAIEVGRSMGAKFTLLTHFSQRYSRIPYFGDGAAEQRTVGVAFDHMTISPDQFHRLPNFVPVLQQMFSDHQDVMDKRTAKRKMKAEWERKDQQRPGEKQKRSPSPNKIN